MNTMMPACFVKLHVEISDVLPAFRSYIKETKSWREPDNTKQPELESERRTAAAMILWAIREYQAAKNIIRKKDVLRKFNWYGNLKFLDTNDRTTIRTGKEAWEWFKNKPKPNGKGWTLERCCEILGLDTDQVKHSALLPSTWEMLKAAQGGPQ